MARRNEQALEKSRKKARNDLFNGLKYISFIPVNSYNEAKFDRELDHNYVKMVRTVLLFQK